MPPRENRLAIAPLIVAIIALAWAVRLRDGTFSPAALVGLSAAIVAMIAAPLIPWRGGVTIALGAALLIQLTIAWLMPPTVPATLTPQSLSEILCAIALAVACAFAAAFLPTRYRLPLLIAVILSGALAWTWTLVATRNVYNDVIAFHAEACDALLHGRNPYATTMPDVYGPGSHFYSPGAVEQGRVLYAFPYPPLTLLFALGGYLLGDIRWGLLAAGIATAVMLAAMTRRSRVIPAAAVAALFLFAPHAFYVTPLAYTDGYVAAALALVVLCAIRLPRGLPIALGLFLATKQYTVVALPLAPLLIADRWTLRSIWRLLWPALLVAALLTLPPLLLDPRQYLHALVFVQMRQPFRADSLGFLPLLFRDQGAQPSAIATVIGFAALLPCYALTLRRFPRTPAGFAAAVALVCTVFFAFGQQAFANYYFFVTAALCCAVAASDTDRC